MSDEVSELAKAALTGGRMSKEESRVFGKILFTYGWRASAFAFALWALGVFDRFGLGSGFALADPTEQSQTRVEKRLSAIERRQLEQDILATYKESCAQPNKDYFRLRLSELQVDYTVKVGSPFLLPTCQALGVSPNG